MPGSFFDTSILVYLASADIRKADRAEQVVGTGGIISVQVLNELSNVARRKMLLSWDDTHRLLATIRGVLLVVPVTIEMHEAGLALAQRYSLSTFDAMVAASAAQHDCDTLWSQDMQHGLRIGRRLRIVDPFKSDASP
jgi:predicted nucleic acid-binding protein